MKKTLIFSVMAMLASAAWAIAPQFSEPQQVDIPSGAHHPLLSPEGKTVVFSNNEDHNGLNALDLKSGKITLITEDAGASHNPVFSADGSTIFFRTAAMNEGLLNRDVRSFSLKNKKANLIAKMSRNDVNLSEVAKLPDYAAADWKNIVVRRNGTIKTISPLADAHSYLWASLSPNQEKLLFSEPFTGVFVSNADGSNPVKILKKGDNPTWLDDEWVLAIISHDNGYNILDSRLFAVSTISGEIIQVTPSDVLVAEVTASPATGKVVYTTLDGDLFLFNVIK